MVDAVVDIQWHEDDGCARRQRHKSVLGVTLKASTCSGYCSPWPTVGGLTVHAYDDEFDCVTLPCVETLLYRVCLLVPKAESKSMPAQVQ